MGILQGDTRHLDYSSHARVVLFDDCWAFLPMRSLFEGEKAVVRHQPRHEPVFHGVASHYQPSPRLRGIDHPTSGESFACTRSIPTSPIPWSRV